MQSNSSAYFVDRPRAEVIAGLAETGLPEAIQREILLDYDKETLGQAWPMLYKAVEQEGKIGLERRDFEDLSPREQLQVVADDIDGFQGLIETSDLSKGQLFERLKSRKQNDLIRDDMVSILSGDTVVRRGRNAVLTQGPGQVGAPARNGGKAFGIKGPNSDAVQNGAYFMTSSWVDPITGTRVSYPQQGHTYDSNNNEDLAREFFLMRPQQARPNVQDGADAKGLVTMTRNQNLINARNASIVQYRQLLSDNSANLNEKELGRAMKWIEAKERGQARLSKKYK